MLPFDQAASTAFATVRQDRAVHPADAIHLARASVADVDRTSPTAKRRWQHAHDRIVEGLFGTYAVQDDPWPGRGVRL